MTTDNKALADRLLERANNWPTVYSSDRDVIEHLREAAAALTSPQADKARGEAYDMIDRYLRNSLMDDDYAEYSGALETVYAPQPQGDASPEEMSPEFTDSARGALAWVLYHHQGGSSPVGQPIRFALGMGAHDPLGDWRIAEAKRWAESAGRSTSDFHATPQVSGGGFEAMETNIHGVGPNPHRTPNAAIDAAQEVGK